MMLSGKEKAQLLISLLGADAKLVLAHLNPEVAQHLTLSSEVKMPDSVVLASFLRELEGEIETRKQYITEEVDTASGSFNSDVRSSVTLSGSLSSQKNNVEASATSHLRDLIEIADILQNQKPQVTAFILSKIDADIKDTLLGYFDGAFRDEIESIPVETIPLSDKVFEKLYATIFLPSPEAA